MCQPIRRAAYRSGQPFGGAHSASNKAANRAPAAAVRGRCSLGTTSCKLPKSALAVGSGCCSLMTRVPVTGAGPALATIGAYLDEHPLVAGLGEEGDPVGRHCPSC